MAEDQYGNATIRPDNRNLFQKGQDNVRTWWYWRNENNKNYKAALQKEREEYEQAFKKYKSQNPMPVSTYPELAVSSSALRYPASPAMGPDSDYVAFKFYKYQPPWGRSFGGGPETMPDGSKSNAQIGGGTYFDDEGAGDMWPYSNQLGQAKKAWDNHVAKGKSVLNYYNRANQYTPTDDEMVMLYMPDDISTGYKANWGGKSVGAAGKAQLVALGTPGMAAKSINEARRGLQQFDRWAMDMGVKAIKDSVKKIGGDVLNDDNITGGIGGVVQNPNAEMLFENIEMRTFALKYKLVPRSATEAEIISQITKLFKRNMLPGTQVSEVFQWSRGNGVTNGYISVPDLVRVSFMKGGSENTRLPQFKMCALTQVDVNYTPDGQYATYWDGTPVATELTLNFQETKLIYKEEADRY